MPNYECVDWVYRTFKDDEEAWKSREKLREKIESKNKNGILDEWLKTSWDSKKVSKESKDKKVIFKDSLGSEVDITNVDYISKIQKDIEKSNTERELNKIKIDEGYEKTTVERLTGDIETKIEELKTDVIEKITEAGYSNDIDSLKSVEPATDDAIQRKENMAYNIIVNDLAKQYRRAGDLGGLDRLKKQADAFGNAKEIKDQLDHEIEMTIKEEAKRNR